ncbi:TPA: hypothetical protein ACGQVR_005339, partial [Klebsiella michiganensis]
MPSTITNRHLREYNLFPVNYRGGDFLPARSRYQRFKYFAHNNQFQGGGYFSCNASSVALAISSA